MKFVFSGVVTFHAGAIRLVNGIVDLRAPAPVAFSSAEIDFVHCMSLSMNHASSLCAEIPTN